MDYIKNIGNAKYLLLFSVCCLALVWFVSSFQVLSSNIYSQLIRNGINIDPYLDFSKGIIASIVFSLFFLKNRTYLFLWFIKVFVTLFLLIPYEFYYGLDSFTYFHWAVNFNPDLMSQYWGGEGSSTSRLIIFIHYLTFIFGDSYYAIKLFFSLLSFFGLLIFYKIYTYILFKNKIVARHNDNFIYALVLFPSIIFWSSGMGKDSLNILFTAVFIYAFIRLTDKFLIRYLLLAVLSVVAMFYLRFWWVAIMTFSMIVYYTIYSNLKSSIFLILLSPILYFSFQYIMEMRGLELFSDIFQEMTNVSKGMSDYGDSSINPVIIRNFSDYMLLYVPNSFTALFRPMIWEARNLFSLVASIENTILLFLSIKYIALRFAYNIKIKHIVFLLIFIISWTIPYSIISSGNLGAAVRFKLQILPMILIVIGVLRHNRMGFK